MKLPYFPMYVQDFLSSERVQAMDFEELGKFTWLLLISWANALSGKPCAVDRARVSKRVGDETFEGPDPAFVRREDGLYENPRLAREFKLASERWAILSTAGIKGGKAGGKGRPKPPLSQAKGRPKPGQSTSESDSDTLSSLKKENPESELGRSRSSRRAPPGFALTDDLREYGKSCGLSDADIELEFAAIIERDFKTPHRDWPLVVKRWFREEGKKMPPKGRAAQGKSFAELKAEREAEQMRRLSGGDPADRSKVVR